MKSPNLGIFDLDGVIVDTAGYHYTAWKEIARTFGFNFTQKDNERLKGVSRMASLNILLDIGGIQLSPQEKEKVAEQKNEHYRALIGTITPAEILPGARELVETMRAAGFLTALGSASKNAQTILEKLNLVSLFDAVVDGNHVKNAKPNPEVFIKAAERLNISPVNCVVFEDAQAGIDAARAAGMKSVGIGHPSILKHADMVVSGLHRLNVAMVQKILF